MKPKPEATTYTATYEVVGGEWLAKVVELPGVEARGRRIAQARARLQQEIKARTGSAAAELEERIIA